MGTIAAIAAPIVGGIGGSLLSGGAQSSAADTAANATTAAAMSAANVQWDMYDQSRADMLPSMISGVNALARLENARNYTDPSGLTGNNGPMSRWLESQKDSKEGYPGGKPSLNSFAKPPYNVDYWMGGNQSGGLKAGGRPARTGSSGNQYPNNMDLWMRPEPEAEPWVGQTGKNESEDWGKWALAGLFDPTASIFATMLPGMMREQQYQSADDNPPIPGRDVDTRSLEGYANALATTPTIDYDAGGRNALARYANMGTGNLPDAHGASKINPMTGQPDVNMGYVDSLGRYIQPDLPDQLDFKLDENDPIYKWKQGQAEKAVNRSLASRGMYNSRPGINALAEANMRVTADEVDKQYGRALDTYGRDYGRGMDLFNIGRDRANVLYGRTEGQADKAFTRKYGQATDLYNNLLNQDNIKYDRNQSQLMNMFNMANQLGGRAYDRDMDLAKLGQGAAGSIGSQANATGQGVANSFMNAGNANAQSALVQGQANANMWQQLGQVPANVMAMNYYQKQMNQPTNYGGGSTYAPTNYGGGGGAMYPNQWSQTYN